MAVPRYHKVACDDYVFEEVRREYEGRGPKGKIRLLRKLQRETTLPKKIAALAVEDQDSEVRQWIARFGNSLDEDHVGRLKEDADPFVRACLRENRSVHLDSALRTTMFGDWLANFQEATHLERLALVRNPRMGGLEWVFAKGLTEKIFDPADEKLGLSLAQRRELVFAYLTNEEAVKRSNKREEDFGRNFDEWFMHKAHCSKLWRLASKWPPETEIPAAVFHNVGTDDATKAEIFQECKDPVVRCVILKSSDGTEDKETIKLGLSDPDEDVRALAFSKVVQLEPSVLEAVLQSKDTFSLQALAKNPHLPLEQLRKVAARLNEDEIKKDD